MLSCINLNHICTVEAVDIKITATHVDLLVGSWYTNGQSVKDKGYNQKYQLWSSSDKVNNTVLG